MKKTIYLIMSLFLVSLVSAIEQPSDNDIGMLMASIDQPVAPGTGTTDAGECIPYEIANRYCNGNVAHYDQCTKTILCEQVASTKCGTWKHFSTNCEQYEKVCSMGKCVKPGEVGMFGMDWQTIGIIAGIIFVIWIITRRK